MSLINSFLLCGFICLIGQVILDNTKLTFGHITSLFVSVGAILSFLGIYDKLISFSKIGSSLPITSFGNLLYKASLDGYYKDGIIGIFQGMFQTTSLGISSAIIFAFFVAIICSSRD